MVPPASTFHSRTGSPGWLNFGVVRGLTASSEHWILKWIIGPVLQTLIRGGVLTAWAGFTGWKGNALPEEEAHMARAALPAAVGTQQNQREENHLKEAASPRAKDLPTPTEGTPAVTYR